MTDVPTITLNDGVRVPQLGFGTYKLSDDGAEAAVLEALRLGYRHIDTAAMYDNERGVGRALAASGLPRNQIFVTTKLWNDMHAPDKARIALNASLERLGLDVIDLYLIHWPSPITYGDEYVRAWDALQEFRSEGLVRSIGVCNFNPEHLDRLRGAVPSVDQVELHPWLVQPGLDDELKRRGIALEAWSPLGRARVLDDPVLAGIAAQTGRTPAQVVLRWHLQRGHIVIPKSAHPQRMTENLGALDFTLSQAQMDAITGMDRGQRTGADPATETF
ncbi:MAG: aldo/keto reductase [Propionibacteriaceae bacterium]|nr:aldo/keto reductase [Propionibacteriaceae bacterium]